MTSPTADQHPLLSSALDLPALSDLARDLAVEAARIAHESRPADLGVAGTKSSVTDVVTEMDRLVEQHLRTRLAEVRPDDAVHGEEDSYRPGTTGLTWVIDPIDGTVNYLYGRAGWSVSVAVVAGDPRIAGDWEPLAGAVADPSAAEVYVAHQGGGARRSSFTDDGGLGAATELRVNEPVELGMALVETGFGYLAERRAQQAQVVAGLLPQVRDIRRVGSAALDLCWVAAGEADAYYESGLNSYDIAAGVLIAREAGAVVTGLDELHPTRGMLIAGGPRVQAEIRAVLREFPRSLFVIREG